jgi:hypothetical protein
MFRRIPAALRKSDETVLKEERHSVLVLRIVLRTQRLSVRCGICEPDATVLNYFRNLDHLENGKRCTK